MAYRSGRAPRGDSLDQTRVIFMNWLNALSPEDDSTTNAVYNIIVVDKLRITQLLTERGHFPTLFTPPYHPELQPIEDLWRDVKQYVARQFSRTRTFKEMENNVVDAFKKYGTPESCRKYCKLAETCVRCM